MLPNFVMAPRLLASGRRLSSIRPLNCCYYRWRYCYCCCCENQQIIVNEGLTDDAEKSLNFLFVFRCVAGNLKPV